MTLVTEQLPLTLWGWDVPTSLLIPWIILMIGMWDGWTQLFSKIDSALELGPITIFGHDYGTPIGIRMMVEHYPDRFDAFIDANASLPDGTFISPVHLNWRKFVRENQDVPIGHVISSQLNAPLTQEEILGYYAPWPNATYKMAIRTFPEMVPDDPSRPEAMANHAAWEFMEGFQQPFMTIFWTSR